jgi:hypothetical protein
MIFARPHRKKTLESADDTRIELVVQAIMTVDPTRRFSNVARVFARRVRHVGGNTPRSAVSARAKIWKCDNESSFGVILHCHHCFMSF